MGKCSLFIKDVVREAVPEAFRGRLRENVVQAMGAALKPRLASEKSLFRFVSSGNNLKLNKFRLVLRAEVINFACSKAENDETNN